MSRTHAPLLVLIALTLVCQAKPKRERLTQFARMVRQQNHSEDPGRWIGQTSVREYRQVVTGMRVVFVSMIHVGDTGYYRGLTRYTREADLVLFEGIGDHKAGTRMKDSDLPEVGNWIRRSHAAAAKLMNQRGQWEWERAVADKRWQRFDLSPTEFKNVSARIKEPILPNEWKKSVTERERVLKAGTAKERLNEKRSYVQDLLYDLTDSSPDPNAAPTGMERMTFHREVKMWKVLEAAVESKKHKTIVVVVGAEHTRALAPQLMKHLYFKFHSSCWHDFLIYDDAG